jgi:3-hydroxymyristoyl/3-hydroxydecanoyl-(acyl carrier protein) dehydratase
MAAVNFTHRPVAGIAGAVEFLSDIRPGQVLELAAELESVDTDSAGYSGTAHADGKPVVRLRDCVGPMVPIGDFDDPKSLQDRYRLLRSVGTPGGAFQGLPPLLVERQKSEPGHSERALLHVPRQAPFFADHFPRRPVFPGTLLMHANLEVAAKLAATVPSANGTPWIPRTVTAVKLRSFIAPGETLHLEARRTETPESSLVVAIESRLQQRLVGSADIRFSPESPPAQLPPSRKHCLG